jgi:glycosyltransferase involved in cell wall biosynthesis
VSVPASPYVERKLMKVALLSSCARLDDAVGKYTFYLARILAMVSHSKIDVILGSPISPQFSAEKVRVIRFETLPRRVANWIIDRQGTKWIINRLPPSVCSSVAFRFRGWGLRSVESLAREISSADLVWDIFASSSVVHHIPLEMRGQPLPTLVFDYHGLTSPELVDPHQSLWLHESIDELRLCAPNADHFVVHSKFVAEELAARTGVTRNVDVIRLFCDPELFGSCNMSKRLLDRFSILFVGRVIKHKGLDILIQALKIIRDRGLDANVIIAGRQERNDNTTRQIDRLAINLGVNEHIFWLGNVTSITLRSAYSTADVLVLPSRHEGFGLPPIEAMWFDLPVIVSSAGALPEVVKNGALVFKTDDRDDLADKILMLHDDLEVRNRTLEAARSVRELYTIDKFCESVREVCERYLA